MIKKIADKLVCFVSLALFTQACLEGADVPIRIRGIANFNGSYIFSVFNTETNQFRWLEVHQQFDEFVILSYNQIDSSIKGIYQNETINLKLAKSELFPTELLVDRELEEQQNVKILNEVEIEKMVNDFTKKEQAKLPDENHPHYLELKQLKENKVNAYKRYLINKNM